MRRFFTTNLLHFFSVLIISNILLGMFLLPISQTYADTVHLKNGSKLTGLILTKFPQEATTVSITLSPTSTLEVHQNQILKITQNKPNKQAYLTRRRTAPHTIKSHLELAKLCKKNGWHTDRNLHLNRILEIDPQHNFSNRELGNKKKQGHWLSPKEFLLSRGLFLYEGRYRPHQAIELLKRKKKTRELEAAWKEKIYRWRRWLSDRREKRVLQAHKGLQTLTDPYAASALIALIEEEKDPQVLRMLLHSASQIESQTTFTYLLGAALFEPHEETRLQCLEYIQKANRPGTTQYYLRFLEDRQNHIVNRAAFCLQQLADRDRQYRASSSRMIP